MLRQFFLMAEVLGMATCLDVVNAASQTQLLRIGISTLLVRDHSRIAPNYLSAYSARQVSECCSSLVDHIIIDWISSSPTLQFWKVPMT